MLKSMRKNMKIVLWILIATFVLWGGSSAVLSRSKTSGWAGEVFGKKTGWKEYEQSYSAVYNQAKLMYGEKFNQISQYINLEQEAWMRIMLLREAQRRHISASNDETISAICSMPLFQDASGKFVPQIYARVTEYFLKAPAREFEEQIKGSIMITKLRGAVIKGVTISDEELKKAYNEKYQKVNADYALISADSLANQVEVNDEKIKSYYQTHKEALKTPLRINIEYIPFEYSSYKTKDEAENAASDFAYEIGQQKKPDIYAVAKKFNLKIQETGFFTINEPIPGIGPLYAVSHEAFKLEPGQVSNPIKTDKGRYIICLKDKKEPYTPTLDEARDKVKNAAIAEEASALAEKKADELLADIKQNLSTGWTFKKACDKLSLKIKSTGLFAKEGPVPLIDEAGEFINAAFGVEPGRLAGVAKTAQGAAIIFVTKRTAIDEKKFEAEKESFKKDALQDKQEKYFNEWFKDLQKKADLKITGQPRQRPEEPSPQQSPAPIPLDDF